MPNPNNRYINIKTFVADGTTYTTLQGVSVDRASQEIIDHGDDEQFASFLAKGVNMVRVQIGIRDPVQAKALEALTGKTITFKGTLGNATSTVNVSLAGFTAFRRATQGRHNAVWDNTVSGICVNSDGSDPETISTT